MSSLFTSILANFVLPKALDAAKEKVERTNAEKPLLDFFLGELAYALATLRMASVIGLHEESEVQEVAPRWFALHEGGDAPEEDKPEDDSEDEEGPVE